LFTISQSTAEEIRLSQDRRDAILTFVLDYFTGDQIDRRTLAHFAFIAEVFGVNAKVKEMVGKTSSVQGRQELCVSLALAALNLAVSDEPIEATAHQLERRELRAAQKQFEAAVVAAKSAKPAHAVKIASTPAPVARPAGWTSHYYHKKRAQMSPEELAADRVKRNEAMRRYGANRKAKKARNP
jgi:hypothetical protein